MGKLCEGLAKLSGWTAGACLVLALLCVSGDVRAYDGGEDEECPACEELPPNPTPEQIAAYEACIAECNFINCSMSACQSINGGCTPICNNRFCDNINPSHKCAISALQTCTCQP